MIATNSSIVHAIVGSDSVGSVAISVNRKGMLEQSGKTSRKVVDASLIAKRDPPGLIAEKWNGWKKAFPTPPSPVKTV